MDSSRSGVSAFAAQQFQKIKSHISLLAAAAFGFAAVLLLFGSKSSPLYPMNDWVDVNVYMTLGRGILNGKVPYRDLFEQKGPVLFFWHALLAVFFKKSYFGVYLTEVLTFGLFLLYSARITSLYVKNRLAPYLVMLVLGTGTIVSPAFSMGGGLEEIYLFCFTVSLYFVLRALREKRLLSGKEALLIGLFAGLGFWSKYTFCGFFAALALFVVIWYISRGEFLEIVKSAAWMILGFGAVCLPVFLYFGINSALSDLYKTYFTQNLSDYAVTDRDPFQAVLTALKLTYKRNLLAYNWLWWPGTALLLRGLYRHARESLAVVLCFWGLALTTYMYSPGYIYYGLILAPFALCGLVALAVLAEKLIELAARPDWQQLVLSRKMKALLAAAVLCLLGVGAGVISSFSSNSYLRDYKKEELPQYRFAAIIREQPGATLLNYWFLDGGFYYAAGVEPINRFFCYFNANPPELRAEQEDLVRRGAVDFVVTRRGPLPEALRTAGGYEIVDQTNFFFSSRYYDYYLYRRNK